MHKINHPQVSQSLSVIYSKMTSRTPQPKLEIVHSVSENQDSGSPQLLFKSNFSNGSIESLVSKPMVTGNFISEHSGSESVALSGVTYSTGGDLIDLNESSDSEEEEEEVEEVKQKMYKEVKPVNQAQAPIKQLPINQFKGLRISQSQSLPEGQSQNQSQIQNQLSSTAHTPEASPLSSLKLQQRETQALKTPENKTLDESETPQNPVIRIDSPDHEQIPPEEDITSPLSKSSITTESKERIMNRVQQPVKTKQELKLREKKLQESRSVQDKQRIGKRDPNKMPFDFQRFLAYLKSKNAESIVKYLKSFLIAFSKKSWAVSEQVKLISDFKNFIYGKMTGVLPFSKMSETEFINCQEGMEKLIMNRLYDQVFSPVIQGSKLDASHAEDLQKDERLKNQVLRFSWIRPSHLDLDSQFIESGENFVSLAISELIKINNYRSPRDKIICVLNCCKVIFAMLKNASQQTNADFFIPTLIYIVIKTDEDLKLNSNISYVERFRNEDGLAGEVSYYLSSFWAVIGFIENLNKDSLTIEQEEWDAHMKPFEETAANEVDEVQLQKEILLQRQKAEKQANESNSGLSLIDPEVLRSSLSPSSIPISQIFSPFQSIQSFFQSANEESPQGKSFLDDLTGSKPATPTGKIKQQVLSVPNQDSQLITTPTIMSFSKNKGGPVRNSQNSTNSMQEPTQSQSSQQSRAEFLAQRAFEEESQQLSEKLEAMFPNLDKEIIKDIVMMNKARASVCVDACLALMADKSD